LWAVYTTHPHIYHPSPAYVEEERTAIGIISGGATVDSNTKYIATRERSFPFELIFKSLTTIKVEEAQASIESDRRHILNSIAGRSLQEIDEDPLTENAQYAAVDNAVRATFVSTIESLQKALEKGDDVWALVLEAMSKGRNSLDMTLEFKEDVDELKDLLAMYGSGWNKLTAEKAVDLISHLPPTVKNLYISHADFGAEFIDTVTKHIQTTSQLDFLGLNRTVAGGEEGRKAGKRFAGAIALNVTIKQLYLHCTDLVVADNVEEWGVALMSNKTLEELYLEGVEDDVIKRLKEATKTRSPYLLIW